MNIPSNSNCDCGACMTTEDAVPERTFTVPEGAYKELLYMVELHKQHGAPNHFETVEDMLDFILLSIADGSRRPGAWERGMLEQMGLIADCPEHRVYRDCYGAPDRSPQKGVQRSGDSG